MALYDSVGGNLRRPQAVRTHGEAICPFANGKADVESAGLTFAMNDQGFDFAPAGEK